MASQRSEGSLKPVVILWGSRANQNETKVTLLAIPTQINVKMISSYERLSRSCTQVLLKWTSKLDLVKKGFQRQTASKQNVAMFATVVKHFLSSGTILAYGIYRKH